MSLADQTRDVLDSVEEELLAVLKDAETLTSCLKDLPEKESVAKDSALTIFSRLQRIQDGILDNIDVLADYIPFERSATQSRLKARQAKSDLDSASSSLYLLYSNLEDSLAEYEYGSEEDMGGGADGPASSQQQQQHFSPSTNRMMMMQEENVAVKRMRQG